MNKRCSNCGAPAPDEASVFCNRCGARLPASPPAPVLTCRTCGKTFTDPQSRFCNRCGSPLAPAAQAASPKIPAAQEKICPACGFKNVGEFLFYCKKCGASIPGGEPFAQHAPAREAPRSVPTGGGIRIRPDGLDEVRQRPVNSMAMPSGTREPVRQVPLYEAEAQQELARKRREEASQKRVASHRRMAYGAAAVLLLVLVIAVIAVIVPGIVGGAQANATAPGLLEGLPWGIVPNLTSILNQSTPVINDTPLNVTQKVT
ncbi:MAG: zinc ribbon domain-containing protein [Methanoregula sp.]|nr:zinc ribbon domain-containing protein [Methanoregula sp.]